MQANTKKGFYGGDRVIVETFATLGNKIVRLLVFTMT